MKVLIVEDETAAARNLQAMLAKIDSEIEVAGVTESIVDTVEWLSSNGMPDMIFMDIHIADGESFRIFDLAEVEAPIIFTTAYDSYALEAFKVNSIDYLLKPLKIEDLERAINKWRRLSNTERTDYKARVDSLAASQNRKNDMFLVHVKDKIIPLKTSDVCYFYTFEEKVTAHTSDGKKYPIAKTLESLQEQLPEYDFFRANRQFIVSRKAVKDISVWFGSRLSLNLSIETPERIIISKARVPEFKRWMTAVQP